MSSGVTPVSGLRPVLPAVQIRSPTRTPGLRMPPGVAPAGKITSRFIIVVASWSGLLSTVTDPPAIEAGTRVPGQAKRMGSPTPAPPRCDGEGNRQTDQVSIRLREMGRPAAIYSPSPSHRGGAGMGLLTRRP